MFEGASILTAYFAFALLHAASPERVGLGPVSRLRLKRTWRAAWRAAVRVAAVVFFSLSVWLWSRVEAGPAAILVAFTALMVAGSSFVLLVPVWPRAAWGLAILCPPAIAALSLAGASHG
jgi:hypothetical protein